MVSTAGYGLLRSKTWLLQVLSRLPKGFAKQHTLMDDWMSARELSLAKP
jgi:hypothetical protein